MIQALAVIGGVVGIAVILLFVGLLLGADSRANDERKWRT